MQPCCAHVCYAAWGAGRKFGALLAASDFSGSRSVSRPRKLYHQFSRSQLKANRRGYVPNCILQRETLTKSDKLRLFTSSEREFAPSKARFFYPVLFFAIDMPDAMQLCAEPTVRPHGHKDNTVRRANSDPFYKLKPIHSSKFF